MSQCIEKFSDQIQRKHINTVSSYSTSLLVDFQSRYLSFFLLIRVKSISIHPGFNEMLTSIKSLNFFRNVPIFCLLQD